MSTGTLKGKPAQDPEVECPRCERRHRTWNALAKCLWPRSIWVSGNGRYASRSDCPHSAGRRLEWGGTVILYDSRQEAEQAKAMIDRLACGGQCWRRHKVVDLAGLLEERFEW
jgi:hypothetical protein